MRRRRRAGISSDFPTTGLTGGHTRNRSPPVDSPRTLSNASVGRASIFSSDEFDFTPATYKPYLASSVSDLLKSFDEKVAEGTRVLAEASDKDLVRPWRLKVMGRVRVEKPKAACSGTSR